MSEYQYVLIPSNRTVILVDDDGNKTEVSITDAMIKSESVLSKLPDELYPGAWAWTPGMTKIWNKDFDGTWIIAIQ